MHDEVAEQICSEELADTRVTSSRSEAWRQAGETALPWHSTACKVAGMADSPGRLRTSLAHCHTHSLSADRGVAASAANVLFVGAALAATDFQGTPSRLKAAPTTLAPSGHAGLHERQHEFGTRHRAKALREATACEATIGDQPGSAKARTAGYSTRARTLGPPRCPSPLIYTLSAQDRAPRPAERKTSRAKRKPRQAHWLAGACLHRRTTKNQNGISSSAKSSIGADCCGAGCCRRGA